MDSCHHSITDIFIFSYVFCISWRRFRSTTGYQPCYNIAREVLSSVVSVCDFVCLSLCRHDNSWTVQIGLSPRNLHSIVPGSKWKPSSKMPIRVRGGWFKVWCSTVWRCRPLANDREIIDGYDHVAMRGSRGDIPSLAYSSYSSIVVTSSPIHRGTGYCFWSISLFVCLFVCIFLRFFVSLFLCFFVSKITRKRLDRFAWNFQGRCGVTMGRPDYIVGQFRETARCATRGRGLSCFRTTA